MVYLSSFHLSSTKVRDPHLYPYHVFQQYEEYAMVFDRITVLYGDNASGKSTILNIIANALSVNGKESVNNPYFRKFVQECKHNFGDDEEGYTYKRLPEHSRYIKSEDVMYEIKKIQQESILKEGYLYEHALRGYTKEQRETLKDSTKMYKQIEILKFAQEKYSNGETTIQILMDTLQPDGFYLLDEPEVSLSPSNQVILAEEINKLARYLDCQFIIATHSPFMLGTLGGKIYNLDSKEMEVAKWTELNNVRYYYEFFKNHEKEFY